MIHWRLTLRHDRTARGMTLVFFRQNVERDGVPMCLDYDDGMANLTDEMAED